MGVKREPLLGNPQTIWRSMRQASRWSFASFLASRKAKKGGEATLKAGERELDDEELKGKNDRNYPAVASLAAWL